MVTLKSHFQGMKETASGNSISHKLNCPLRTMASTKMNASEAACSTLWALAMGVKFCINKNL